MEKHYTINEIADYLNIHHTTVRDAIKKGKLPAKKIGSIYRITESAINEWTQPAVPVKSIAKTKKPAPNAPKVFRFLKPKVS